MHEDDDAAGPLERRDEIGHLFVAAQVVADVFLLGARDRGLGLVVRAVEDADAEALFRDVEGEVLLVVFFRGGGGWRSAALVLGVCERALAGPRGSIWGPVKAEVMEHTRTCPITARPIRPMLDSFSPAIFASRRERGVLGFCFFESPS